MKFEKWMNQVDNIFESLIGLTSSDLEDYCWWDCWNDGMTPKNAVNEFLIENGYVSRFPDLFKNIGE